jgi:asparagine synthase (glutamine-hydrolysing)
VALGHRRLAILDLTAASAQPMIDAESGVVLSYNGELYNFVEVRSELEALGHRFDTRGDVEVVTKAIVEWRERAFERFAGMFAIAAWDPRSATLWLARDALGMKPLYLARHADGIAFASEVKALLELGVPARLDPRGLVEYLEFGYRFEPRATMFEGIERLGPGEVVGWRAGREVARFRHFRAPSADRSDRRSGDERARELLETLSQVVDEHLVADVPVGLLLSGGLDSSLVAALAARRSPIRTVSMGFAESTHDERDWARRVAAAIGSEHQEIAITPDEIAAEIESSAWIFDDLFADWGTVTTRLLYRRCRELGLKVALVGEGADELFAGYPIFEATDGGASSLAIARLYRRYAGRRWGGLFGDFRRVFRELLDVSDGDLFEAVRRFEVERQLPANYVMKVDKASMSVSLEARAPYLDRRVAALALATPREWLLRDGTQKWLLRRAATISGALPREIATRPKAGGSIAASWLDDHPRFREFARERVLAPGGFAGRVGLRGAMERYFAGERTLPFPNPISHLGALAWRLLLLELWAPSYGVSRAA